MEWELRERYEILSLKPFLIHIKELDNIARKMIIITIIMMNREAFERKVAILLAGKARRGEIATPRVRSCPQRMDELEIAARERALRNHKETYYIHRRCKKGNHYSRKITETGECVKCLLKS